jgi:L-gulono-1,4-lactone dehydrogenase
MIQSNWLGNVRFNPRQFLQPRDEGEIADVVRKARSEGRKIRVVGSGHSFSPVCQTDDYLVNLDGLSGIRAIDQQGLTATVGAGSRLKELNAAFWDKGFAFVSLGNIAEQSLAGASGTATHGSGIRFGNLAAAMTALKIIDGNGDIHHVSREKNPDTFPAFPVSFGSLGIITEFTLKIVPKFFLRETRKPMPFDEGMARLPALIQGSDHFKLWWFPHTSVVQTYSTVRLQEAPPIKKGLNPFREDSPVAQLTLKLLLRLGERRSRVPAINRFITKINFKEEINAGRSFEIFRMAMPPRHHESEYAIPVEHASEAMHGLRNMIERKKHRVNFVSEMRFVMADDLWLSPSTGRDVCYIGGYMAGDTGYAEFLADYEDLMRSYGGRPHWGKEFTISRQDFRSSYPRWEGFRQLKANMDPAGTFENPWIQEVFAR